MEELVVVEIETLPAALLVEMRLTVGLWAVTVIVVVGVRRSRLLLRDSRLRKDMVLSSKLRKPWLLQWGNFVCHMAPKMS
jgi:hypothetical protein